MAALDNASPFLLGAQAKVSSGRVRLGTLVGLRWLALLGQTGAVLLVGLGLGFAMPLGPTLAVIGISAALNAILMSTRSMQALVREWEAALQLAFDLVQLALLLALTGGVENPFAFLFVAPVAVSATALRPVITAGLAALAFCAIATLAIWHAPLPWPETPPFRPPALYQLGMTIALMISLIFTSIYAWRVAAEEERLALALAAAEAVLAREQAFSALGALAAATAHELGTPLATIHLAAKEMAREMSPQSPFADDVHLIVSQTERCRAILTQLSNQRNPADKVIAQAPLSVLLNEVAAPHRGLGAEIVVRLAAGDESPPPVLRRLPEMIHGLGAIVENAVGFAQSQVDLSARWSAHEVIITVEDDGPGFSSAILPRLGEPYLSERPEEEGAGGLGLGFFIAKTLLERSGGRLSARNRPYPGRGARVSVIWERASIEAEPL